MAKNRSKEASSSRWSECLNSKACCLIPLRLWAHGRHDGDSDNEESNSYRLQSPYYAPGT